MGEKQVYKHINSRKSGIKTLKIAVLPLQFSKYARYGRDGYSGAKSEYELRDLSGKTKGGI